MFINLILISILFDCALMQVTSNENVAELKFLLLVQSGQESLQQWLSEALASVQDNYLDKFKLSYFIAAVDVNDNSSFTNQTLCKYLNDGYTIFLDATWSNTNWLHLLHSSEHFNAPYFKLDLTVGPTLRILDSYLAVRNATDVILVFGSSEKLEEALYYWVDRTSLRMLMMEGLDDTSSERLRNLHPYPSFYIIVAKTANMLNIIQTAVKNNLIKLAERWILLFLDFENDDEIKSLLTDLPVSLIHFSKKMCCPPNVKVCKLCPKDFLLEKAFFIQFVQFIINQLDIDNNFGFISTSYKCEYNYDFPTKHLISKLSSMFTYDAQIFSINISATIETKKNSSKQFELLAQYTDVNQLILEPDQEIQRIRRFYRIGTAVYVPWTYYETDPKTKETHLTGYCVDFAHELSKMMDFSYELVIPNDGGFGRRNADGVWNGIVGDLVRGVRKMKGLGPSIETDMIIGAITMTAEREEVIDFVPPYFEQTGISIVMRKPIRKTSLFKFMTVLRLEVWLSIVGALIVTGFMIWFLDKYSPYSARNNAKAYPYPCRRFTLKESFWFALTSFTPQGGGEAPKALSGRTLVAAYWLFVVLMLATFTANLAAFLTVERMQSPVQSLEQLAKQSRINYTVVEGSWTHQYFINMKHAEDTLYRLWKELTLNATTDQTQYRVWDYPIREQYGHILLAINDSIPVANYDEGFRKVNEHVDGDFAFIHDSAMVKYEISRNCNLTEIGEVFAERPYAVAVQQGSHLSDQISKAILDLQKDRFFEDLKAKYWNNSAKGICPDSQDSEGITLESLGGVFIATLFGLALAMITLLFEVIYYRKKKQQNKITQVVPFPFAKRNQEKPSPARTVTFEREPEGTNTNEEITIGSVFQPVAGKKLKPASEAFKKANYFTVYSRSPIHATEKEWQWEGNFLY